ncbi:uncharacterized protein LOC126681000 isoform X2 [Mercurialis annua]|uniref:uncharacterized protein LOC126681000 isoform X2 n=1 Tax=Mercurialis annua TaxID=3986 RepID=UPI0024AE3D99|nr:uncharacterized protein LOC126681000 isoform X2 [Mercurialis annua]
MVKVNVQRILAESTKNHVKKLSEEAECKNKSRKAIVLDQGNPSMKNQLKQLALAESNPWKAPFKRKEPPYKKQKVEPTPVPKSTFRSGVPSTTSVKGRHSMSPLPSTPQRSNTPASPFGIGNISKNSVTTEEVMLTQMKSKENVSNSEKEIQIKASNAGQETPGRKGNFGTKPMDLQSFLIATLIENPKGMSLKALEKAVTDKIPKSAKKIEPVIKKIAIYQAPGKYLLKPGVDLESFKKLPSESGSSPEDNNHQTFVPEDNHDDGPALESRIIEKSPAVRFEEHAQINSKLEEENAIEKIDVQRNSPDLFVEKKISDNSEEQAGSSSESGSDSDSDTDSSDSGSDSGSRSRSRSRSKSPVGSGSSSDSESDASSNSKEGSDEDVDILCDDDKEPQLKVQACEPGFSASPDPWKSGRNGTDEKQDGEGSDAVDIDGPGSAGFDVEGHESGAVDIEKDWANDEKEVGLPLNASSVPTIEGDKHVEGAQSIFSVHDAIRERQNFIGTLFDDNENMTTDSFRHENSDSSEKLPKSKPKRGPDVKHIDEKSDHAKRSKVEIVAQLPISEGRDAQFSESPQHRDTVETFRDPVIQVMNKGDKEGNTDFGSQKAYNQAFNGKANSDFQQPGRTSADKIAWSKASDSTGKSNRPERSGHGHKFAEKDSQMHEDFPFQREKSSRETPNEDNSAKEKKLPRNSKEGGVGGRHSTSSDSHRKQRKAGVKLKDDAQVTNSHIASSPKNGNRVNVEKYPPVSGRSLQRELSELELGEFREPLLEEKPVKKQFDRKGSFRQSDNKPTTSDSRNSDLNKANPAGKTTLDSGKPSPSNIGYGVKRTPDYHIDDVTRLQHKIVQSHPQHLSRIDNAEIGVKRTPDCHIEDVTRSQHKSVQSHPQHLSRVDNAEVGPHLSKLAANGRLRQNEAGSKLGHSIEGYGESHRRGPSNAQLLHASKRGLLSNSTKESKTQSINPMPDLIDNRKDIMLAEVNNNPRKRRESSSEEDGSYLKYEKDVPELKGPIKDASQYEEYVQEYRDKYDSYCSLDKSLETYRNDFLKLGKDLEFTKGRDIDRHQKILMQLMESYRQCGARHKRLKKIFVVLHEELENLKQKMKEFAITSTKD